MFIFSEINFSFFPDALFCVVLRFDRSDMNTDGNLDIIGVSCSDNLHTNIVREIHEGNKKLWKITTYFSDIFSKNLCLVKEDFKLVTEFYPHLTLFVKYSGVN